MSGGKELAKLLITVTSRTQMGWKTAGKSLKLGSSRWNAFYNFFWFFTQIAYSNRDSDNWGSNDDNDNDEQEIKWEEKNRYSAKKEIVNIVHLKVDGKVDDESRFRWIEVYTKAKWAIFPRLSQCERWKQE